jgi:hypothetical protein
MREKRSQLDKFSNRIDDSKESEKEGNVDIVKGNTEYLSTMETHNML